MLELTVALVVFLFPLAYSPGPGNLFFAVNGARFGFAATMRAMAGYHVATLLMTVAIGLGFAVAIDELPTLFMVGEMGWLRLCPLSRLDVLPRRRCRRSR